MSDFSPVKIGDYVRKRRLSEECLEEFIKYIDLEDDFKNKIYLSLSIKLDETENSFSKSELSREIYNFLLKYANSNDIPISSIIELRMAAERLVRAGVSDNG